MQTQQYAESQPSKRKKNVTGSAKEPRRSELWRTVLEGEGERTKGISNQGADEIPRESHSYTKRFRKELEQDDLRLTQQGNSKTHSDSVNGMEQIQVDDMQHDELMQSERKGSEGYKGQLHGATDSVREVHVQNPGQIAKDDKFLQSVASLKRGGRKRMDAFDEEFNNLHLTRQTPFSHKESHTAGGLLDDPEYQAWQNMCENDFDVGAAGNFVQVDFVPLLRPKLARNHNESLTRSNTHSPSPNFKKFRYKGHSRRAPVDLDLAEAVDYGVGHVRDVSISPHNVETVGQDRSQESVVLARGTAKRPRNSGHRRIWPSLIAQSTASSDDADHQSQPQGSSDDSRHEQVPSQRQRTLPVSNSQIPSKRRRPFSTPAHEEQDSSDGEDFSFRGFKRGRI